MVNSGGHVGPLRGLAFTPEQFKTVTQISNEDWATELKLHDELFTQLAQGLPAELPATKARIEQRLAQA